MLLGRRMYEVLVAWETMDDPAPEMRDFAAIWRGSDKVVYSRTLAEVSSARTRIEREFDPDVVRGMKAAAERDLSVGGPELAAHAIRAGLVDECQLFLSPIVVGGGTPALPEGLRVATRAGRRAPVRQWRRVSAVPNVNCGWVVGELAGSAVLSVPGAGEKWSLCGRYSPRVASWGCRAMRDRTPAAPRGRSFAACATEQPRRPRGVADCRVYDCDQPQRPRRGC